MTKSNVLMYLKNKKDEFQKMYGIINLGLYGSYARDEATSNSDVDIFYTTNDKFSMGILEFSQLIKSLEADLKTKVDFVNLNSMDPVIKYYAKKDFTYV
ncbi:MAG: nucleotidyltransferase domain-containing protein [Arcobacteraceae bacterium]|nr:nucleotidyltransferase domain-containing protein [Arcobacteraceae bacterium]